MGVAMNNLKNSYLLFLGLIGMALCMLAMIIGTSHYIRVYSKEPVAITGKLEIVNSHKRGLEIRVDQNSYILYKIPSSGLPYGIIGDIKIGKLLTVLNNKTGKDVRLEYIQISSNQKNIVSLTVDGFDYVDKEGAINDFTSVQRTMQYIGIVMLALTFICFFLVWKGKIRLE